MSIRSKLRVSLQFVLGFLTIVAAADAAIASDWARFRGPNGSGISPDAAAAPVTWSDTDNLKWSVDLPGQGVSCPIVVGDRVIVTCWTGTGRDDLKRHLVCYDRADRPTDVVEGNRTDGQGRALSRHAHANRLHGPHAGLRRRAHLLLLWRQRRRCVRHGRQRNLARERRHELRRTQVGHRLQPGPLQRFGDRHRRVREQLDRRLAEVERRRGLEIRSASSSTPRGARPSWSTCRTAGRKSYFPCPAPSGRLTRRRASRTGPARAPTPTRCAAARLSTATSSTPSAAAKAAASPFAPAAAAT